MSSFTKAVEELGYQKKKYVSVANIFRKKLTRYSYKPQAINQCGQAKGGIKSDQNAGRDRSCAGEGRRMIKGASNNPKIQRTEKLPTSTYPQKEIGST